MGPNQILYLYCSECECPHRVTLPHTCQCGHVLLAENLHVVTGPSPVEEIVNAVAASALWDVQTIEDARCFAALQGATP